MKKTKIALQVCCILLCIVLCTGCVITDPSFNNMDTDRFYTNIKFDADADYGKKTAVYQDRIYYLSAEDGTQGVYSMRFDGSAVQLEFAAEDIRALAVKNDGFYYTGFSDVDNNINGDYRRFRLYHRATAQSDPVDLLNITDLAEDLVRENVWDFYIAGNGYVYIRIASVGFLVARTFLSMITMADEEILFTSEYELKVEDNSAFVDTNISEGLMLYQNKEQYVLIEGKETHGGYFLYVSELSEVALFDATINRTALPIDAVFLTTIQRPYATDECWILRLSESKILFGTEAALATYDIATHTGTEISSFPPAESIYATYDTGTDIILLTKEFRSDRWIAKKFRKVFDIPTKKGENLYRADSENGERTRLLSLGQDEAFLYVDDDLAASAAGNIVSLYDIGGETAVPLRTIELEHEIVDSANKVDAAGDWLFLYRFNDVTGRDELLEKVFIG
jgi:hypothetical protein